MATKIVPGFWRNKSAMRNGIVFAAVLMCLAASAAKLYAAPINDVDVRLFTVKCGSCHGWNRAFKVFSGPGGNKRAEIILAMQKKKPGYISDAETARITQLLSVKDLKPVAAEAEKISPNNRILRSEKIRLAIMGTHSAFMVLLFVTLGIYMALTGLKRFFTDINFFKGFPVKFNRNKHVKVGKIYIILALFGFSVGMSLWIMSHFNAGGAKFHLIAAFLISALYLGGGISGLMLAKTRGKSPSGLKYTHLTCNVTATLIFIFNIVTGLSIAIKIFL